MKKTMLFILAAALSFCCVACTAPVTRDGFVEGRMANDGVVRDEVITGRGNVTDGVTGRGNVTDDVTGRTVTDETVRNDLDINRPNIKDGQAGAMDTRGALTF
jgi:hypothetical protein